jgi:hypothetical protein
MANGAIAYTMHKERKCLNGSTCEHYREVFLEEMSELIAPARDADDSTYRECRFLSRDQEE